MPFNKANISLYQNTKGLTSIRQNKCINTKVIHLTDFKVLLIQINITSHDNTYAFVEFCKLLVIYMYKIVRTYIIFFLVVQMRGSYLPLEVKYYISVIVRFLDQNVKQN